MLSANWLAAILGAVVGMALGLSGAGGGVIAVPALMRGLGFASPEAGQVALLAVGTAALLRSIEGLRQGLVRYKAALWMTACGSIATPVGVRLAAAVPPRLLTAAFCILMLYLAQRMARQALRSQADPVQAQPDCLPCSLNPVTGLLRWSMGCARSLGAVDAAAGFCSGLFGVGGGFLIVPGLRQASNVTMHGVVATSLAVIALVSAASMASAVSQGMTISPLGWIFVAAVVFGTGVGRRLMTRVSAHRLQWGFATVQALLAVALGAHTFLAR